MNSKGSSLPREILCKRIKKSDRPRKFCGHSLFDYAEFRATPHISQKMTRSPPIRVLPHLIFMPFL